MTGCAVGDGNKVERDGEFVENKRDVGVGEAIDCNLGDGSDVVGLEGVIRRCRSLTR